VRSDLAAALAEGRGVTAKIRWLTKADLDGEGEGRPRWIHCTPLLGHSGAVGVWMIVLVDEEGPNGGSGRRFRTAPPVSSNIGGKDWEGVRSSSRSRERERNRARDRSRHNNRYDKDSERRGGTAVSVTRMERSDYFPLREGQSTPNFHASDQPNPSSRTGSERPSKDNSRKNTSHHIANQMHRVNPNPPSKPHPAFRQQSDVESREDAPSELSFGLKTPSINDDPRRGMIY
jgi:hypothetical protein